MRRNSVEAPNHRRHLQTIVAELTEGIVIIEGDGAISWANDAALAMHGVADLDGLGRTLGGYHERFVLSYRNNHILAESEYPGRRTLDGEALSDIVVRVARRGGKPTWTYKIRSVALDAGNGGRDSASSSSTTRPSRPMPKSGSRRPSTPTPHPRSSAGSTTSATSGQTRGFWR